MLPEYLSHLCKNQSYNPENFFLIAGPCVVEREELVMEIAEKVYNICKRLEIPYIFYQNLKCFILNFKLHCLILAAIIFKF